MKVKCNEIKIGNRVRKDLGNIEELADSIKELGLLQPIGVTIDNELVFGERRLAACKSLNYEEIEVVVIDSDELLKCETTENVNRKGFVMSERVAIRALFKDRFVKERGKLMAKGIKVSNRHLNKTRDRLAKLSGVGQDKAKKEDIIIAYNDQDIIKQVDNNGLSVNKAYNLIKKMEKGIISHETENLNEVTDLPVEEVVEVAVEQVQIDNNKYSIVLSDNYGTRNLSELLSREIKRQADEVNSSSLINIEDILNFYFKV